MATKDEAQDLLRSRLRQSRSRARDLGPALDETVDAALDECELQHVNASSSCSSNRGAPTRQPRRDGRRLALKRPWPPTSPTRAHITPDARTRAGSAPAVIERCSSPDDRDLRHHRPRTFYSAQSKKTYQQLATRYRGCRAFRRRQRLRSRLDVQARSRKVAASIGTTPDLLVAACAEITVLSCCTTTPTSNASPRSPVNRLNGSSLAALSLDRVATQSRRANPRNRNCDEHVRCVPTRSWGCVDICDFAIRRSLRPERRDCFKPSVSHPSARQPRSRRVIPTIAALLLEALSRSCRSPVGS